MAGPEPKRGNSRVSGKAAPQNASGPSLRIKIRMGDSAIGPGKIALLELIESKGSISAAARAMDMSYRRAWHLIDTLNANFDRPLIETSVGGARGGGARLSEDGRELIRRFREVRKGLNREAAPLLDWLEKTCRPAPRK